MEVETSWMQLPRWTKTKLERNVMPPRLQDFDEGANVVGQRTISASNANFTIQALERRVPNHLLMVALLEHLCTLYESDPEKNKNLFKVLCQQLSRMKVIPGFVYLEEFGAVRNKYKEAISDLFKAATSSVNGEGSSPTSWRGHKKSKFPINNLLNFRPSLDRVQDLLQLNCSRYKEEFLELERIGKGGFGSVFKVKNQLDGREYAVKKIPLRETDPERCLKVIREVKVLASLNHINVVGYHSAWLEYVAPEDGAVPKLPRVSTQPGRLCDLGNSNSSNFTRPGEASAGSFIIFEDSGGGADEMSQGIIFSAGSHHQGTPSSQSVAKTPMNAKYREEFSPCEKRKRVSPTSAHNGFRRSASSSNLGVSQSSKFAVQNTFDQGDSSSRGSTSCTNKRLGIVLFIQMQLCKTTLKDWIVQRNSSLCETGGSPDISTNRDIFRQICEGVKYIHSQRQVHRDIKPRNIFLQGAGSGSEVPDKFTIKIGDFGLARSDMFVLDPREGGEMVSMIEPPLFPGAPRITVGTDSSLHNWPTMGVGTCTYASPEQLHNERGYDMKKSDIYSLGIVLFELFSVFGTDMERFVKIKNVRKGIIDESFKAQWPEETKLILEMMAKDPADRPSADDILQKCYFSNRDEMVRNLELRLTAREREVLELRKMVEEQQQLIQKLRLESCSNCGSAVHQMDQ